MATKVPTQKPSEQDFLLGIHHALNIFLQGDDFKVALHQSLVIVSKLTDSQTTFFFRVEHDSFSDHLVINGECMLVAEEDTYNSLAFDYTEVYDKEMQANKLWLRSLLAGQHIVGYDKKFAKEWQKVAEMLALEVKSYMVFPLIVKGRLTAILGLANNIPQFKWSATQLLAMDTFVATFAHAMARHQAEEKTKQERDYLLNVINELPSPVFTKNREGELKLVNKAMADFYGMSIPEMIGKTDADLGHSKADIKSFIREDKKVLEKGEVVFVEGKKYIDHAGQLRVLNTIKTPIRDKQDRITETLCLVMDVTEQKMVEARLKESHLFRSHLTALLPECILLIDVPTGSVIFSNHTHFVGYEIPTTLKSIKQLISFLHPQDNCTDWKQFVAVLQNLPDKHVHTREYPIKHQQSGQTCWVSELSRVFKRNKRGEVLQFMMVLRDVTDEKTALKKEAFARKRYQNFIRYSIEGIYYVSCQPGIPIDLPLEKQVDLYYEYAVVEECNESMASMYGLQNPKDFIGLRVYDMHKGDAWEQNRQSTVQLIANDFRVEGAETIEIGLDGVERHYINHAVGVIEDKKFVGLWGVQQEISEKRQAEKALLESEIRLNNIVQAIQIGLWEWDITTGQMTLNDQGLQILNITNQDPNKQSNSDELAELIHPDDLPGLTEAFAQHAAHKTEEYEAEFRVKSNKNVWKWTFTRGRVVEWNEKGEPYLVRGTFIDIDSRKRSELLLRENQALMSSLFNNSSLGIKFIDQNEIIFQANQRYCDMVQVSPQEVIGRNAFAFNSPDQTETLRQLLHEAIAAGKDELTFEKEFIRSDQQTVWARVTLSIFRHEDKSVDYVIALLEDITERRQNQQSLKESKALLEAALQTLPDLKFRMDLQGTILEIYATEHDLSFFGMPSEQAIGKNLNSLLPLFAAQGILHNAAQTLESGEVQKVALLKPIDGQVQHYEARMNAINETDVIVVVRDVTENMLTEQELYETIHKMELSNRKLQSYIDSNLQLENFAYIASHDLREPIRTMRTFAQIIDKRYRDKFDEDGRTYLDFVINSAEQMNQLIMDLLTYSRINSEATENVEINIGVLLRDIVSHLSQSINENKVDIATNSLPDTIQGSPTKLKQLFQNLIINAIKFRHPDRDPIIRITAKETTHHWQFSVIDNGIGIQSEFYDIIFALFKRLHNRKDYQGTGLGLAICKKIVEQHNGEIWVESEPNQGTTFHFTLQK